MKALFDLTDGTRTFKGMMDILIAVNVALFGVFEHWATVNTIVAGAMAAIISLVLFAHIRPLKNASMRFLIWANSILLGMAVVLYGLTADWWNFISLLCNRGLHGSSMDTNKPLGN